MINFKYLTSIDDFKIQLESGNINNDDIVFINDTNNRYIWAKGQYYTNRIINSDDVTAWIKNQSYDYSSTESYASGDKAILIRINMPTLVDSTVNKKIRSITIRPSADSPSGTLYMNIYKESSSGNLLLNTSEQSYNFNSNQGTDITYTFDTDKQAYDLYGSYFITCSTTAGGSDASFKIVNAVATTEGLSCKANTGVVYSNWTPRIVVEYDREYANLTDFLANELDLVNQLIEAYSDIEEKIGDIQSTLTTVIG